MQSWLLAIPVRRLTRTGFGIAGIALGITGSIADSLLRASFGWQGFSRLRDIWSQPPGQVAFTLLLGAITLFVVVARLRDMGRSGWWALALPLLLLLLLGDALPGPIHLLCIPLFGYGLLLLYLVPGTPGTNRSGPDPRARRQSAGTGMSAPNVSARER